MIILDTNVVSEALRPKPNLGVRDWLDTQPADALFICAPVLAEIRFGIERLDAGVQRQKLLASAARLESVTFFDHILPFDAVAATIYGRIAAQRQSAGRPIGVMDCMIAAIALAHQAAVATRDRYGFDGVGLTVINPFEI
ncbi:MAG TPA: type II toxin-antitoxin system VapC family toxin [Rhodopseudomonas sp.]|uniref:type II toxin-antitoxin system VapC family toxin n=1 Tax=Rhodopseudomonas sp. TaxID=1078 RepID=UPI002ED91CBC